MPPPPHGKILKKGPAVDNYLQNWFSKGCVSINIPSYETQNIYKQINKDYLQS
jgi:hypothetical protein